MLNLQSGEHVSEIGFGTGTGLLELASVVGEDGHVDRIDLSPGMFQVAYEKIENDHFDAGVHIQHVKRMDIWSLPVVAVVATCGANKEVQADDSASRQAGLIVWLIFAGSRRNR